MEYVDEITGFPLQVQDELVVPMDLLQQYTWLGE